MLLQLAEAITVSLSTPPAHKILFQIVVLKAGASPRVVLSERIIGDRDEKGGVEAVIMFPMLHPV